MRAALWFLALFGIAVAIALFAGNNQGTVTIFWPGGGQRAIFFDTAGKPIGFDANQADGSAKAQLKSRRDADLNLISIGTERYEIPDVVVVGD